MKGIELCWHRFVGFVPCAHSPLPSMGQRDELIEQQQLKSKSPRSIMELVLKDEFRDDLYWGLGCHAMPDASDARMRDALIMFGEPLLERFCTPFTNRIFIENLSSALQERSDEAAKHSTKDLIHNTIRSFPPMILEEFKPINK